MRLRLNCIIVLACLASLAPATRAQLLPGALPGALPGLSVPVPGSLAPTLDRATAPLQRLKLRELLRANPRELDSDRDGQPVIRGELLAIAPTPAALEAAAARGFGILRDTTMEALGLRVVVLSAPAGQSTQRALRVLRRLDPDGHYDFNHLYLPSDAGALSRGEPGDVASPAKSVTAIRVGLVDSGVDASHPALSGVRIQTWGCDGASKPERHGTAVASLLAGQHGGSVPTHSQLFAADIYCGKPTGGAVTELGKAFAWLARERVAVINVSLVGPPNALLEQLVAAMVARGHVLVAAVGNEGPAAPPRYPAAYPGVIGVTALGLRDNLLPEAGSGAHVDFAAPGAGLFAAAPGMQWWAVRGTSFAAPLVARFAAEAGDQPVPLLPATVEQRLARVARDAGARGRDRRYGFGVLAEDARSAWPAPLNKP